MAWSRERCGGRPLDSEKRSLYVARSSSRSVPLAAARVRSCAGEDEGTPDHTRARPRCWNAIERAAKFQTMGPSVPSQRVPRTMT